MKKMPGMSRPMYQGISSIGFPFYLVENFNEPNSHPHQNVGDETPGDKPKGFTVHG